jgi:6-phosphogluconolactonase/glucosamine-6-phosphate isomerase/deaminase
MEPEPYPLAMAFLVDERYEPSQPSLLNEPSLSAAFGELTRSGRMELISWDLSQGPALACAAMDAALRGWLGPELRFDLACLGLGPDGHTAGLFEVMDPYSPGMLAGQYRAPSPPLHRLSMSAELLSRSRKTMYFAKAAGKEEAIGRLTRLDPSIAASRAASPDSSIHVLFA